jgi:hypothetical protein
MYIHGWISEQFSGSQAALGTTFRVTAAYRKVGTSFLKMVIGRIFAVKDFIEASRNFILDLNKNSQKL